MIVGSLGKIVFMVSSKYIKTIDELKMENSVDYAEHKIIKGKPKLEFLNENLKTATFNIRLSAFKN
ncbi:MAG: phage tail protein, partial [Cetobacterium sp.]